MEKLEIGGRKSGWELEVGRMKSGWELEVGRMKSGETRDRKEEELRGARGR